MGIPPTLTELAVALTELRPYPRNPRRGALEAIKDSLRSHGQFRPIVVNRPTMQVLAGNHLLEAARALGFSELACTFVEVDEEQAKRIVLADNRTSDLAGYDDEALVELLGELPDLLGTGYDQAALDDLLDEVSPPDIDDEELPPPPAEPASRPGDLYRLGPHRLLCGDARDPESYERLLKIEGDGAAGLEVLLSESFTALDPALAPGARLYLAHPAGRLSLVHGIEERLGPVSASSCLSRSPGSSSPLAGCPSWCLSTRRGRARTTEARFRGTGAGRLPRQGRGTR